MKKLLTLLYLAAGLMLAFSAPAFATDYGPPAAVADVTNDYNVDDEILATEGSIDSFTGNYSKLQTHTRGVNLSNDYESTHYALFRYAGQIRQPYYDKSILLAAAFEPGDYRPFNSADPTDRYKPGWQV